MLVTTLFYDLLLKKTLTDKVLRKAKVSLNVAVTMLLIEQVF